MVLEGIVILQVKLRIEAVQDVLMIARRAYAALIAAICTCCMPAYMALAAEPVNIVHDPAATYGVKAGTYKSLRVSDGQYTLTLPSYVDKVKVTCVGAGGGPSHSGYLSTKAVYGGGGGAVVQNTVINIGSNKTLTIVVGKAGSWGENGGASYVIYNGQQYGTAAGGKGATTSAAGAPGGSGGGVGGAVRISGVINNAGSGVDGTAGGRTYVQNASGGHITAGGGASWKPGLQFNWVNGAFAVSSSYATACGSGAAVYHSQSESTNYTSYAGDGLVAVSYAVQVTGISISRSSLSLTPGSSANLSATVSPADAQNKSVVWSSSNANVATVSSSGKVTGVANGTTIITVKSADKPSISRTCTVTVTTPTSGVTVTPESVSLNTGQTHQLTATVSPATASNKSVTWSTSRGNVATVSNTGLVTAVGNGTATITARTASGGYTDTCTVTVSTPVTGVSLSSSSLTIDKSGTHQLTATVSPETASNKTVSWSTSDPDVAYVSQSGLVTAVGGGTADITVTTEDGSYTAQCKVTVNVPVIGVLFDEVSASMGMDSSTTLGYTVLPADASNKSVTWQSSNTAVAMVDADTGVITPVGPGGTEITVTTVDGNFSDTLFLMVTSSLDTAKLTIVTESGYCPDFATVYNKVSGYVVEYPGIPVGAYGEVEAPVPSGQDTCTVGVSLLNTLIAGTSVTPGADPESLYMIEGDFNADNVIDGTDYTILVQRMHFGGGLSEYGLTGDINYDGVVDKLDLMMFGSPVAYTGQSRFMQEGYDIESPEVQTNSLRSADKGFWVPVRSLLETKESGEGRYEVSLQAPSEPMNMLQIALEGDITETSAAAPEDFELIGAYAEAGKSVVAIGSSEKGGSIVPADVPIVTVKASETPSVIYGEHDTVMQRADEYGIENIPLEMSDDAGGAVSYSGSGGSGCNFGLGALTLLIAAPLLFRNKHGR